MSDLQYELITDLDNADDEDNEQKHSAHRKSEAPTLSLNTVQIANEH